MEDILNDIPCIYFSSSAEGFIIEANENLCNHLGYTKNELAGRKLESIFTLATRIFQQTHFFPLLQLKGHAEEIYITLSTKNGDELPVLINAVRKEKENQTQFCFAGIAINKRKKYEDEIIASKKAAETALSQNIALKAAQEDLQKRAEELDKQIDLVNMQNKELKQFNHITTHTLQEPLRKLLFYSNQIIEKEEDTKNATDAQKIKNAAEAMYKILKGLQKYVWLTNEDLKWDELDIIHEMNAAKKQIELENPGINIMLEADTIPSIEANKEQILFLLKELFLNAVRFRKPGNVVNLKIAASTLLLNKFRQLSEKYKYAEFVKIQIQDNGIGFDDKYQAQAFELFRKLHPMSGQGIGLSLCKKIVENHNGSIYLESQKNTGTTVIMLLPIKQDKDVF